MITHVLEDIEPLTISEAVDALKVLADETRLKIIWALLHGEHSVGELADHVGAAAPAVSQHLARLRFAKMVQTRRQGNKIFYSAKNQHLLELVAQVLSHAQHLQASDDVRR